MSLERTLLLVGLIGLLGSGGCGGEGGDGLEAPTRDHKPETPHPQRIVSLIPAATGILAALGAEASLVGVGEGDPSPAARGVESVGSILTPTWERVVALDPTLLVLWTAVDATPVRQALPDTVVVLRETIETLGDLERVTRRLGVSLGKSARAEELVAGLRGGGVGVPPCARGERGPTAAWVVSIDPIVVAGTSSWPAEVLEAAGARAVPGDVMLPWPTLSSESLVALEPELVVTAGVGEEGSARLRRLLPRSAFVPVDGDRFHVPTLDFASLAAELSARLAPVAATPLCTHPAAPVQP